MAYEKSNNNKNTPETALIRVLPFMATLQFSCVDCGRVTEEHVGQLVNEARLGHLTPMGRAAMIRCRRNGCGGELGVEVDLKE